MGDAAHFHFDNIDGNAAFREQQTQLIFLELEITIHHVGAQDASKHDQPDTVDGPV